MDQASLVFVRGPVGRGLVAAGLSSGSVALVDIRSRVVKAESMVNAHPGGLAYVDSRSDTLVTCGYTLRQGQVIPDAFIKLFDVRFAMKPMLTLTFNAGASCLSFHPTFSSVLLVSSASGLFSFADTAVGAIVQSYQVDTAGDALTSCAISSSGEMIAFGGSGGYVHLWTAQEENEDGSLTSATVNQQSEQVEVPSLMLSPPTVNLTDSTSISLAEKLPLTSGNRLLSDIDSSMAMSVGLPPRLIDPSLLKGMKQVDFVGYLINPHFSRGKAQGEATRLAAPLRSKRVQIQTERSPADLEGQRAERSRRRIEQGGVLLPLRYQHIEIKTQSGYRFEEFDFSFYNRTRFAGLENNIPNCYCNALLQALYFIPSFREMVLAHKPEPDHEFCLVCEIHFLFRMLALAHGIPCQAANLLQALRQVREAAALGLLDGLNVPPGVVLPETEGPKAWALSRRLASLQRFLLDHMHNLCKDSSSVLSPTSAGGAAQPLQPNISTSTTTASMKSPAIPPRSGIPQPDPANADLARKLEEDLALGYKQRMICLSGPAGGRVEKGAEKSRDARCFQIDLKYSVPGSFSSILQASLQASNETRAWFDEKRGYCMVRQSRVPIKLPKVLAINCSPSEMADVEWWSSSGPNQHQLPWCLIIEADPSSFTVSVRQGTEEQTAADLLKESIAASSPNIVRAAYDLTCVISHIRDADVAAEAEEKAQTLIGLNMAGQAVDRSGYKGHLISCIRVPQEYWNEPYAPSMVPEPPVGAGRASMTPAGSLPRPSAFVEPSPLPAPPSDILDLPDDLDDVFSFGNDSQSGE
jgi:PAB-dependent poly(A)-specific ribonuclease subunit 2